MKWVVGISVIALAMGWAATMTIPAATISPDEATLKLLPPETQAVAFIDVEALRNAPLAKDFLGKATMGVTDGELDRFFIATGFVPQRDIDRVTAGRVNAREMLAIVEARFDKFKVEQFFRDKGKEPEVYLGRSIYRDGDASITLLDNLVIAGNGNAVKKALDQMSLPGSQPMRSDLMDAIRTIEAGNQIWAVGDFSIQDFPKGLRGPAPAIEIMKSLRSGTYQMRVDQDIHAKAVGNFADAEAARNLSEMARGFIAVAKLQVAKEQPDLLHVLDGIQVGSSGASVVVHIDEPGDLLIKLKDLRLPKRRVE